MLARIVTTADHDAAIARIDALWDATPGTPEAAELDRLAELVHDYESNLRRHTLPSPQPTEVIAARLRELGWSQRELGRRLGWSSGRVSEVISGKRALTLAMVRDLAETLDIPAGVLVYDPTGAPEPAQWVRIPEALAAQAHRSGYLGFRNLQCLVESLVAGALAVPSVDLACVATIDYTSTSARADDDNGGTWVPTRVRAAA